MRSHSTAIVWFRRDLRLRDNPALRFALTHSTHVLPLYVFAPDEDGDWAPGAASALAETRRFKRVVSGYATSRDRPDLLGTSRLSPHLHFGGISLARSRDDALRAYRRIQT